MNVVPVKTIKIDPQAFEGSEQPQSDYKRYQIDLNEDLAPPPVAMSIKDDTTLFTKGNFSIITGAAKSRKSFLVSMLMAEAISNKGEFFSCPCKGTSILFDTEQAKYKVQEIGKRITELAGTNDNLIIYSLRTLDPTQRLLIIEQVLADTPDLNFVAIDGIIDLDNDPILQADQAQRIIQKLMQWSEIYNIHICCVLHYNKTISTLLGHLGSFAHRKADAVISVTKDKNNEFISIAEPVDTREKPFQAFSFNVDENGLPRIIGTYDKEQPTGKKSLVPKDIPEATHSKHIREIYEIQSEYHYKELVTQIKLKYNEYGIEFGESKARDFLRHCENLGYVHHNGKQGRAAKYISPLVNTVGGKK